MESLYDRIGGEEAVNAAVKIFYSKVMADPTICDFFDKIDMQEQVKKQRVFLTYAFGGAPNYSGESMRAAHKKLVVEDGLNDSHFDAVAENLQSALEQLSVPSDLISEVMTIAASTRDDVLNR